MTRQDRPTKLQPDHKNGHKVKPVVLPEQANEAMEVYKSQSGLINSNHTLTSTSGQPLLAAAGLQAIQRQALASQIGLTQGNWYLQRFIGSLSSTDQQPVQRIPGADDSKATTGWTKKEIRAIQRQLRRLGFYQIGIDGIVGRFTESGLVEAFGGDEWRTLDPEVILQRLETAVPPTGKAGEHKLRYGEMFRDGLLDMTLGVGFDEGGNHKATIEKFRDVLATHQFREDSKAAIEIYKRAGRAMEPSAFGVFFVRENALIYKPPAGAPRPIHAVVRFVSSAAGDQGAEAAGAFEEGMVESDIAYYSGHGRYGSGPDFDPDMSFDLLDREGKITEHIPDYEVLRQKLHAEGKRYGRSAWQQFLWRVKKKRIEVIGTNKGNVYLNAINRQPGLFGSKLMHWNLKRQGGAGATRLTGRKGSLAASAKANPERRYRLFVFDGCNTRHYEPSIRATKGFGTHATDILATRRTVDYGDDIPTLATFLDSILGQQSAEQIVKNMDALQSPKHPGGQPGGAYEGSGFKDNPVVR